MSAPYAPLARRFFSATTRAAFFAEERGIEQVAHAQTAPRHFVFVSWADAAGRCADFVGAARAFGGSVELAVVRENQVRAIADVQAALHVNARLRKGFNFVDERARINNDASPNDGVLFGPQNATGNELQDVLFFADDDGVPGIVAAGHARDVIKRTGEIVNDFAFTFVTPLRADDDDRFHSAVPFFARVCKYNPRTRLCHTVPFMLAKG